MRNLLEGDPAPGLKPLFSRTQRFAGLKARASTEASCRGARAIQENGVPRKTGR